ncbi:MAG: cell division topological specificity factor MinE [Fusobacterium sp.]|nr:cell division topological specificity factor MinE [Fusobacterium sp.]
MGENIFTDIYNKVMGFFRQTDVEETAKDTACNRLRVVLMQDRTNLNPQLLEKMRKELIELLSKYVEMDKEALELNFEQEGEQMALMLSIPVLRARPEEEIEKALEESEEETAEEDEEENSETPEDAEEEPAEETEPESEEEEKSENEE